VVRHRGGSGGRVSVVAVSLYLIVTAVHNAVIVGSY
jgi:hypothetical protein